MFHILTPWLYGLSPCAKDTLKLLHYPEIEKDTYLLLKVIIISKLFLRFSEVEFESMETVLLLGSNVEAVAVRGLAVFHTATTSDVHPESAALQH